MLLSIQSYAPFVSEACSTRRGRPLCLPAIFTHFVRYCSGRPFATLLSEGLGEVVCPYMWACPGRIGVVREADCGCARGGLMGCARGRLMGCARGGLMGCAQGRLKGCVRSGFEGGLPKTGEFGGDFCLRRRRFQVFFFTLQRYEKKLKLPNRKQGKMHFRGQKLHFRVLFMFSWRM